MINYKISIITITFNPNADDLIKNLESVYSQKYINYEHIIQDGSKSNVVLKIIEKFKYSNPSSNIRYFNEKDLGIYDALNKAIKKCDGQIIGMLHTDDIFNNEKILLNINSLFQSKTDLVYGDLVYVNKKNKVIRKWVSKEFKYKNLFYGWMPPHPTIFLNKEVIRKYGLYNINFKIAGDYDFILRILKNNNIKIFYLPSTITRMKIGGTSNKSIQNIILKSKEDLLALKNNNIGGVFTLVCKNISKLVQFF